MNARRKGVHIMRLIKQTGRVKKCLGGLVGAVLVLAWCSGTVLADPAGVGDVVASRGEPRWRLFAVEYARSDAVAERRLVHGASPESRVGMSWYFFVAVGYGRIVLIDCGTDALVLGADSDLRRRWSIVEARPVERALALLGVGPGDVTDVILTHYHWDHVGGLRHLRRAVVYAHGHEWARVPRRLRRPVERAHRFRPAREITGGSWADLEVIETGHHTRHQLSVLIRCGGRTLALVSDAAYTYRNIQEGRPVTVAYNRDANRDAITRIAQRVGEANVVPGHDPAVFDRYPSPVPGVAVLCR